eukprot:m.78616 g.78616  ORF g.78616 m.78616 type:complete len:555 (+) comp14757_c0_seq3:135-1799(+)
MAAQRLQDEFKRLYLGKDAQGRQSYSASDVARLLSDAAFAARLAGAATDESSLRLADRCLKARHSRNVASLNVGSGLTVEDAARFSAGLSGPHRTPLLVWHMAKTKQGTGTLPVKDYVVSLIEQLSVVSRPGQRLTVLFDVHGCSEANIDLPFVQFLFETLRTYFPGFIERVWIVDSPKPLFGLFQCVLSPADSSLMQSMTRKKAMETLGVAAWERLISPAQIDDSADPETPSWRSCDEHSMLEQMLGLPPSQHRKAAPALSSSLATSSSPVSASASASASASLRGSHPATPRTASPKPSALVHHPAPAQTYAAAPASSSTQPARSSSAVPAHVAAEAAAGGADGQSVSGGSQDFVVVGKPEPPHYAHIDPSDKLVFHAQPNGEATAFLLIHNQSEHGLLAYKIRSNGTELFRVSSPVGIVPRLSSAEVLVHRKTKAQPDSSIKFKVMVAPFSGKYSANDVGLSQFWQNIDTTRQGVQTSVLSCKYMPRQPATQAKAAANADSTTFKDALPAESAAANRLQLVIQVAAAALFLAVGIAIGQILSSLFPPSAATK